MREEEFLVAEVVHDALNRRLRIISEEAKRVPDTIKEINPDVDWREAAGMRDVLIHDYADVDQKVVWGVIRRRLDQLELRIGEIPDELGGEADAS